MLIKLGRGFAPINTAVLPVIDSSPQTVAVFGDSISAQNSAVSGTTTTLEAYGYMTALNYLTNSRYIFEHSLNKGTAGQNTTQMVSNVSQLNGLGANLVVVHGGTNDIASNIPAATIQSNLQSVYNYITGTLGAKVIAIPILPRTGLNTTQKAALLSVNAWIRAQASSNILIADPYADFNNGSDEPKTDYTYDGLHPSAIGAFVMAQSLKNVLSPLYGNNSPFNPSEGSNLLSNGSMTGTAGTIGSASSGVVATGWKLYGFSNGTRVGSKNIDGSQNIVVTIPSGGASAESVYLEWESHVSSGYAVGDKIVGEIDIEVVSGTRNQWLGLEVRDVGALTNYYIGMDKQSSSYFMPSATMGRGTIRTPSFLVQSGNTRLEYRLRLELNASSAAASMNFKVYGSRLITLP